MTRMPLRATALAVAISAALALAACGDSNQTVGQQVDQTLQKAENQADRAAEAVKDGADRAADAMKEGAQKAETAMGDAAITAAVNAKLAADSNLSMLKIDVDTADGRVQLKGQAPTEASRLRATELAQAVDGVKSVDNQLVIVAS